MSALSHTATPGLTPPSSTRSYETDLTVARTEREQATTRTLVKLVELLDALIEKVKRS